jgi:hypothetical protein
MREHWLEHAHGRIVAGDDELDVLADYGWVQLTDAEREAVRWFSQLSYGEGGRVPTYAATLRSLLTRLHT